MIAHPSSDEHLARDLGEMLASRALEFERDVHALYDVEIEERLAAQAARYEERLAEVLSGESLSRLRLLRRRARSRIIGDVERALAELREETVRL